MITVLTNAPIPGGNTLMTFKLTEPKDQLDKDTTELGEFLSERLVKLGLGGNVFRALGYRWGGGRTSSDGYHEFWYKNVERDRFKNGPLYIRIMFGPDKNILKIDRVYAVLEATQAVAIKPVKVYPELATHTDMKNDLPDGWENVFMERQKAEADDLEGLIR